MTSRVGHTTNQPFGMHLRHVHVPASSPCLPPLSGLSFLNPKVGVRFWFEPTQNSSNYPMPFANSICLYKFLFTWYNLLEVYSLYFTCNLMWYILCDSAPLKKRWCPHHIPRLLFFAGLLWNSSMASWACSISDSFTQEASIGWYPFHLTKYSYSRPLSCLDLSTTSTSNSGLLWTKSGGGLEFCSRLGLKASQATAFKKETWNVRLTLRFSGCFNL